MTVLIDPPRWPAHGTVFSHLVSDESLAELHAFAARAEIPPRAFDHDHYDVPARRYDDLVAHGAVPVRETELVRRLLASGLRVRSPDRTPNRSSVLPGLSDAWRSTLPGSPTLGRMLVDAWSEPHRHYHDVRHLAFVLDRLDELSHGDPPRPVVLAAWFHDAILTGRHGQDESDSADLAERHLTGVVPGSEVAEVSRLIRLTANHAPETGDDNGAMLCDADLAILSVIPGRYDVYVRDVRLEYDHLTPQQWRDGRRAVVDRLLTLDTLYNTSRGFSSWEDDARGNLQRERAWLDMD